MSRYRRINIDGKSITETRLTAVALLPGTLAVIDAAGKFAQATAAAGRLYVINLARLANSEDEVPSGLLELSASVAPGGVFVVRDQHGREVAGVKSVAVFTDQSGAPVFQVNL